MLAGFLERFFELFVQDENQPLPQKGPTPTNKPTATLQAEPVQLNPSGTDYLSLFGEVLDKVFSLSFLSHLRSVG